MAATTAEGSEVRLTESEIGHLVSGIFLGGSERFLILVSRYPRPEPGGGGSERSAIASNYAVSGHAVRTGEPWGKNVVSMEVGRHPADSAVPLSDRRERPQTGDTLLPFSPVFPPGTEGGLTRKRRVNAATAQSEPASFAPRLSMGQH